MEHPIKSLTDEMSSAGSPFNPVSPHPNHWDVARDVHGHLVHMGMPRVNLLFIGRDRITRSVLDLLLLELREPLTSWHAGESLVLPRSARGGTLILHDVNGLTADDQRTLLDWLDADGGSTQVVSTTPVSLVSRVDAGTFIERLYYRLNTVCVDVSV